MAFQNACPEVGHGLDGVGLHGGFRVLNHEVAVLVIGVDDGECSFGKRVEKCLLGVTVVLESAMVVEMVACEVGEDATCEGQTSDAVLVDGVAAAFHEHIRSLLRASGPTSG